MHSAITDAKAAPTPRPTRLASLASGRAASRALAWSRQRWELLTLGGLVAIAAVFHLWNRGHLSLGPWDESVHAVVAEHLALHPLHPTLYETAALTPSEPYFWVIAHTWLHVPPFGMWMSALSMRLLGNTPFALRLPGLLFVLVGMVVTYLLGRRLFGPRVALVGAVFAGFAPYPLMISQGYMFGDITDTPLMLFVPLAVLLLVKGYQTGQYRWLVAAGVSQGVCYLAKGAIGLGPTGVAVALCACDWLFVREDGWHALHLRGLAAFLGPFILAAAPYSIYTSRAFPAASAAESHEWISSFFTNVEWWGQPPDTHVTSYLYAMYGPALALLLMSAAVTVAAVAFRRRSRADLVVVVWIAALYLPLSVAVTKTPNVTYGAVPAFGLVVGRFVMLGMSTRSRWARAAFVGILAGTVVIALLIMTQVISNFGIDYTMVFPDRYLGTTVKHRLKPYVLEIGLASVAAAIYLAGSWWLSKRRSRVTPDAGQTTAPWTSRLLGRRLAWVAAGLALLILGAYWLRYDAQVVGRSTIDAGPDIRLGQYLEAHTPPNATVLMILYPQQVDTEQLRVMFWAHRDVYSTQMLRGRTVCELNGYAIKAASPFYVVTDQQPVAGRTVGTVDNWIIIQPQCP